MKNVSLAKTKHNGFWMSLSHIAFVILLLLVLFAMIALPMKSAQTAERVPEDKANLPSILVPLPDVPIPPDNPMSPEKVELGKLLFFDARLSGDVSTSCASCHEPSVGWGDGDELSRGYPGALHWRNSQTIINSAYLQKLFWAGEAKSLEVQAKSAITGNLAGNGDTMMIEERLAQCPDYVEQFKNVFGTEYPLFTDALRAIAAYERTLVQRDTPFDRYVAGDKDALNEKAKRGLELFQGKAECIMCHNGPLFTDQDYHFLDLPENEQFEYEPLRQIALRYQHYSRGVPEELYDTAHTDLGLYYTTKRNEDKKKFRTPTLRYLTYSPPYMHNGVFYTLEEVIDFYDQGGGEDERQSRFIWKLGLSESEKEDLLEFLLSLSGKEIKQLPPVLPEYAVMKPGEE